ncbi:type II pantothenate kinase [Pseudalkalibacillus decolorationis]|uniref:type II pantothenate kinase n=1 Tax=Pseudalkalibacillus decolorationis TaxID=163879 RepID=UPI002148D530|nr:type II pantothenate kinase [Pseudalkalibacillus decolorationis]
MNKTRIGIDAGGTLVKVAYQEEDQIKYQTFPSRKMDEVVSWIYDSFANHKICVTGGKNQVLANKLNFPVETMVEFDATSRGVGFLARQYTLSLGNDFILANVGTGTSIHYVMDGEQQRIGGTGVGGGTLLGLSYLLTGKIDFNEIVQGSNDGNRENVDLKVKEIFEGVAPPISGDLTASNFGKIGSLIQEKPSTSDMLASIIGLIGETVVTICCQAAHRYHTNSIVYIGSTFRSNPLLKNIIEEYTILREKRPFFLEDGEFSGAIGALLTLN